MKNIIVALGVLAAGFAAPALAQTTPAPEAAPMAAAPTTFPPCRGAVQDSCDQSNTTEKNAMTAAQAEASGGVGDRHVGRKMTSRKTMKRKATTMESPAAM